MLVHLERILVVSTKPDNACRSWKLLRPAVSIVLSHLPPIFREENILMRGPFRRFLKRAVYWIKRPSCLVKLFLDRFQPPSLAHARVLTNHVTCKFAGGQCLTSSFSSTPTRWLVPVPPDGIDTPQGRASRSARAVQAYIHAVGICHRDIKPQNLLVDGCGLGTLSR